VSRLSCIHPVLYRVEEPVHPSMNSNSWLRISRNPLLVSAYRIYVQHTLQILIYLSNCVYSLSAYLHFLIDNLDKRGICTEAAGFGCQSQTVRNRSIRYLDLHGKSRSTSNRKRVVSKQKKLWKWPTEDKFSSHAPQQCCQFLTEFLGRSKEPDTVPYPLQLCVVNALTSTAWTLT
jgi:hypothetical protein